MTLALNQAQLGEIRAILDAHVPSSVKVGVFGSRDGGRVKPFSDLDLALEGLEPLPWSLLGTLAEAFDESLLPFKVDLVDRKAVSAEFGAILDATRRPFPR
jgi:predicted nucleotidyltransferase